MKRTSTLVSVFILLVCTSCHRYYTNSSFEQKSAKHKLIAVLPPQIVMTGQQPRNLTVDQIILLEEKESKLFQEALFNNILRRSSQGKYGMLVSLQPTNNTIALLEKANISLRDSWTKDDKELATILGVDAIVRSTIQKDRYMSDLASMGISVGRSILDATLRSPVITPTTNKTNDIMATCTIVSNGETLWNDSYKRQSDWNSPANTVIENITDNFARHFPYRKKA